MTLNIESIISDAIETCGANIEETIEAAVDEVVNDICTKSNIQNMIKDQINYTVWSKKEELEDMVRDQIADFVEDAVEEYIS